MNGKSFGIITSNGDTIMVTGTARGQIEPFVHVGRTVEHAIRLDVDGRYRFDYIYLEFEINKNKK
jgi:hypothetical protein